jgi:hypothetical protein
VSDDPEHPEKTIKRPMVAGWQNGGARNEPASIKRQFAEHPNATHAGIQTGGELLLIDIDTDVARAFVDSHPDLFPPTRRQRTRRKGGEHLFYRKPANLIIRNSASKFAPGLDVRGEGGFANDWSIEHRPRGKLAVAPRALLDLLTTGRAANTKGAAPAGDVVPEGARNTYLTRQAGKLRRIGSTESVLDAALQALNVERCSPPLADAEVTAIARSVAKYPSGKPHDVPSEPTDWKAPQIAIYGKAFDPNTIPQRRWLVGHRRSVGEVTVDAGPPGTNKSMLQLTDAVAIATGRKLLSDVVHETGGVLFLAGEDARRDVEARLAAILAYYKIKPAELGNRLRVVYLDEAERASEYSLAMMRDDMATLNTRMLDWLREYPDTIAVMVDPLAAWNQLIENSNDALQVLWSALRSVAVRSHRHVGVGHHVTKASQLDPEAHVGNLASLRGGSVLGAGVRWAFTMARLKLETAERHGIKPEEARRFRRLDTLKASYGADDNCQRLLCIESVLIANGESVGVLTEVDLAHVHAEAQQRAERKATEWSKDFADMLVSMLSEKHPRSANSAAIWLTSQHASKFVGKDGKPLSTYSLRQRLPRLIGKGIATAKGTVVIREAAANGMGSAIDFAHSFKESR